MIPRSQRDQVKASDKAANADVTGAEAAGQPSDQRDIDARPTGLPTFDRHAAETAHHWEPETKPAGETKPKR